MQIGINDLREVELHPVCPLLEEFGEGRGQLVETRFHKIPTNLAGVR